MTDRRLDALALATLLLIAVLPLWRELLRPTEQDALGIEARVQIAREVSTRRAFAQGALPLWNPYEFGGRPYLADPGNLVLYLPHLLLRSVVPIERFFPVSFVVHAWLGGVGAYLLARHLQAARIPSVLAGAAVMLSGTISMRPDLAYSSTGYATAWLPLVLALVTRSAQRRQLLPSAALVLVLTTALMTPAPVLAVLAVAGGYLFAAVWPMTATPQPRRLVAGMAVLLGLAAGLASAQLVPTVRLQALTRGQQIGDEPTTIDSPDSERHRSDAVAGALTSLTRARVLSRCDAVFDSSQFLRLGVPGVGGYGGKYLPDYGRFLILAMGERAERPFVYSAMTANGLPATRADLLRLLHVGYLVSCAESESPAWAPLTKVDGATIYQNANALPRAFWTCSPRQVSRSELEYRLLRWRYDERLVLTKTGPSINVRWAPVVDTPSRERAETQLSLRPQRFLGERTWLYELLDTSAENVAAIVNNPSVEDTHGIDRHVLELARAPEPSADEAKTEWLIGIDECEEFKAATISTGDGWDGHLVATVDAPRDGLVFVSETYYPHRAAWIDGTPVEALKVNLAFTGIPVRAGVHRLELRYDPNGLPLGAGLTALTLITWIGWAWLARARPRGEMMPVNAKA